MNGVSSVNSYYSGQNNYYLPQNNRVSYVDSTRKPDTLNAVASAGILQGVALLLQKASQWFDAKLMQGKEFTSADNVKKVAKQMVKDNNMNVDVKFINDKNIKQFSPELQEMLVPVAKGENAFYADSLKLAVAPEKKPSLILHELGHAINSNKGKFLRFLQKSRIYAASAPAVLVLMNKLAPKKENEKNFIERNAGLLGFAAFLPTIIEEGMASIRGVKAAKKVLGKSVNLTPLKRNYLFAWATYMIAGLGLGVAAKQAIMAERD